VLEKLVEEVSFSAGSGATAGSDRIRIDAKYVDDRLADLARNEDLARYVL
jgi:ATP-dependent HslUV protease ATP-binding subunit HslU